MSNAQTFVMAVLGIFIGMPVFDFCFNWWWCAIRDRNKPKEPPNPLIFKDGFWHETTPVDGQQSEKTS